MNDKEIRVMFLERDDDNIPYGIEGEVTKIYTKGKYNNVYAYDVKWKYEGVPPSSVLCRDVKIIGKNNG